MILRWTTSSAGQKTLGRKNQYDIGEWNASNYLARSGGEVGGSGSGGEHATDGVYVCARFGPGRAFRGDAGDGAEDGGVVAVAEEPADLCDAAMAFLLQRVHGEVARVGDISRAAAASQVNGVRSRAAADCVDDGIGA